MPRKKRFYLPGIPCHVIQRGNNRQDCFAEKIDYEQFLDYLSDSCERYDVKIHAYVLMTNHVHLLLTPDSADGISKVMQSLGRRYVQYYNRRYRRTGTLWEGRHRASIIEEENYLFACYRYIELNPVRAGLADLPEEYPWSSFHFNALGIENYVITPHCLYLSLAEHRDSRCERYSRFFDSKFDSKLLRDIREAAVFSVPLGGDRFKRNIEAKLGFPLVHCKRGRPRVK